MMMVGVFKSVTDKVVMGELLMVYAHRIISMTAAISQLLSLRGKLRIEIKWSHVLGFLCHSTFRGLAQLKRDQDSNTDT